MLRSPRAAARLISGNASPSRSRACTSSCSPVSILSSAPAEVMAGFRIFAEVQNPFVVSALAGQNARPVSPKSVSDIRSTKTGMKRKPRDGAASGARYSTAAEYARIPPSAPAGYPRTPNVRRCWPAVTPGKSSSAVPLIPPAEKRSGLPSSVMPPAARSASTWCAKPGRSSDL